MRFKHRAFVVLICCYFSAQSSSTRKETDNVLYFFCPKENRYNRGERQSRKTKSGSWKKTGVTTNIMRKRGDCEKIGEKRVFVFQYSKILGGSKPKSDWVMHEYVATFVFPAQVTFGCL